MLEFIIQKKPHPSPVYSLSKKIKKTPRPFTFSELFYNFGTIIQRMVVIM